MEDSILRWQQIRSEAVFGVAGCEKVGKPERKARRPMVVLTRNFRFTARAILHELAPVYLRTDKG